MATHNLRHRSHHRAQIVLYDHDGRVAQVIPAPSATAAVRTARRQYLTAGMTETLGHVEVIGARRQLIAAWHNTGRWATVAGAS